MYESSWSANFCHIYLKRGRIFIKFPGKLKHLEKIKQPAGETAEEWGQKSELEIQGRGFRLIEMPHSTEAGIFINMWFRAFEIGTLSSLSVLTSACELDHFLIVLKYFLDYQCQWFWSFFQGYVVNNISWKAELKKLWKDLSSIHFYAVRFQSKILNKTGHALAILPGVVDRVVTFASYTQSKALNSWVILKAISTSTRNFICIE